MEVFPDSDLLLDKLSPVIAEFNKVVACNRAIVGARADHVEKRCNAVERTSYQKYTPFSSEFSFSVALRIVSLDNPNALIDKAFSSQAHVHEGDVELLRDVAVRSSGQSHYLF